MRTMSTALGAEFFENYSEQILSLLNILSGSISMDTPLPPFLKTPRAVSFRFLVDKRAASALTFEHVNENGYAVFAAVSVSTRLATVEIERLLDLVKSLVGEMDLRFDLDEKKES